MIFGQTYSESELIADCKKGKPKAQKILYEKYSAKMLGVCLRYLPVRTEAEDAMISGFMKVFEHLASFQGNGSFEGWIRRIVINESLLILRKKNRMFMEEMDKVPLDLSTDFQIVHCELETEDLLKLVHNLPDGYRTVFNLYVIEGYSHKEIADFLGVSESTSKSQLNRARNMLKRLITENE
jgi:RNA polymerase sigma factor (sigma-70 family)